MANNATLLSLVDLVKRHLHITWTDEDTEAKLINKMASAELAINYKLGAECDITRPGQIQQLYLNYMTYSWNECLNEFDEAYRSEILQLRHYNEVKGSRYEPATFKSKIFDL